MNPPARLRIAHRHIELRFVPGSDILEGAARGIFDNAAGRIQIADDLLPPDQAETLIHELLHASWPNFELPKGMSAKDREEVSVSVMAQNLAQVWRDNPEFVTWVSWALTQ